MEIPAKISNLLTILKGNEKKAKLPLKKKESCQRNKSCQQRRMRKGEAQHQR